jgi:transposase
MDCDEMGRWVDDAPTKELYQRRLAIWWTACGGHHAKEIAGLLRASTRTVRRWIHRFNTDGPAALESTNLGGRRWAYLSEAEERAILTVLRPRARAGRLLTAAELLAEVEARVGREVSDDYLYDLLHRHGWRKVEPRPRHVRANPAAQESFKKAFSRLVQGLIASTPRHLRPCLLFEDEARFGRISTVRACWAPPGVRPRVGHQQVREYCQAVLAVSPLEGRISALVVDDGVDHHAMSSFLLETTARFPRRYSILFLNGAGAHIAHDLAVPQGMHLELLPPYSPELNPVEPLWDYMREHYFANRVFSTIAQVERRLCEAFRDLDSDPDLVRSIAGFDWIKAAVKADKLTAD